MAIFIYLPFETLREALTDSDKTIDDHPAQYSYVLGGQGTDYGLIK
jgi:hypothetical protein